MAMKLSFSTNAFVRHPVSDAVKKISDAGYSAVELLADAPHLYAPTVSEADLKILSKALKANGLRVANINANTAVGYYGRTFWEPLFEPSLASPETALRKWRVEYSLRCIDMAAALGSPCISVTSGRMIPGTSPEESLKLLKDSVAELAEYGEERGVRIGMEYEPGLLVERFEELATLIDEVDSDYFGANLDLGHSHVLGEDPETVVRGLSPRIFHIHIEDIRSRKHYHLIPGEGDMDFGMLFAILKRHAYAGFVTVELYTYPHQPEYAAARALKHLRSVAPENL